MAEVNIVIDIDSSKSFNKDLNEIRYTLLSDCEYVTGEVRLKSVNFLKGGESYLKGAAFAERAKELDAFLGQKYAEAIVAKQDCMPNPNVEEYKEYKETHFAFPATVWQSARPEYRCIPYIYFANGLWKLDFVWQDCGFYFEGSSEPPRGYRLLSICK